MRKEGGALAGLRWWMPKSSRTLANNMLTMDEPDHTRLRGIVDEAFRRRAVLDMEPHIRAIADGLAASCLQKETRPTSSQRYARTLPLSVICELLGLPAADRPKFIAWANTMAQAHQRLRLPAHDRGLGRMRRYLEERLRLRARTGGEGLIAELVRVEKEGGRISRDEMVSMVFLLLGAGSETTTHLISGSVYELLETRAARLARGRTGAARVSRSRNFCASSRRCSSQSRVVRRRHGARRRPSQEGRPHHGMIAAANMDPAANDRSRDSSISSGGRTGTSSFGTGIHFCLGHQLARIEAMCALQALFMRWPRLRLAVEPSRVHWRRRPGLRAIEKLPVVAGG